MSGSVLGVCPVGGGGRGACQRNEILFFGQNVHFHFEDAGAKRWDVMCRRRRRQQESRKGGKLMNK